jgi:hypothetical protein
MLGRTSVPGNSTMSSWPAEATTPVARLWRTCARSAAKKARLAAAARASSA